jgi:methylglutaconyl-CoA hydratase
MSEPVNGSVTLGITGDGIATVSFFHPAQNSLPSAFLVQLAETIDEAGTQAQTNVIILKSEGDRTFCAGASFAELVEIKNREDGAAFFSGFARVINACRKSPKIIIGRVQGKAVGGGVGLAAATDYCLASTYASIKLSELAIGIGPFVIAPAVIRKIGLSAFSQLSINASDFQSAQWGLEKGLFNEVHNDIDELDAAVDALAKKLAAYNPDALHGLKKILWEGTENWDTLLQQRAAISGDLVLSGFTQTVLKSFLQGRR